MKDSINRIKERLAKINFKQIAEKMNEKRKGINVKEATKNGASHVASESKKFFESHENIVLASASHVLSRFQGFASKIRKKIDKKLNKHKFLKTIVRGACAVGAIGFGVLSVIALKEVFLKCLAVAAMGAAVMISMEFILWVVSTAVGTNI